MSTEIREYQYSEFINFVQNRKRSQASMNLVKEASKKTNDSSWSGTPDWETAIQYAVEGWNSGLKQLELEDGVLTDVGVEYNPSVCGSAVNMGAYLQGQPDCMFEFADKREYNLPELTIYVPLMYNAFNTGPTAMRFTKSIVKLVNEYQSKHNVKLVGVAGIQGLNGGNRVLDYIVIKDHNARFVLNNIAYAFHPSFFRRLYFARIEESPYVNSGYGSAYTNSMITRAVEEYHNFLDGDAVMFPALGDLDNGEFNIDDVREVKNPIK